MYTIKKIDKIFTKALEYRDKRMLTSLDLHLKKNDLSSDMWSSIYCDVRLFMTHHQINLFLLDEYFRQEFIHRLNRQHMIIDVGETCSPLNMSRGS